VRLFLVDVASLAFCAFFSWKSWTLLHEALVEGQTTATSWAPPLWIPYGTMALGMSMLCVQIALQLATRALGKGSTG
jgi:TRAP-type C4-dicarboxylate transport system permease small subunit